MKLATPRWRLTLPILAASSSLVSGQINYQPVALNNELAPGAGAGVKFGTFGNRPLVSSSGHTCLLGNLLGTGISGTNNSGLWAGYRGSLALYAREGFAAPGVESTAQFSGFLDPILNEHGFIAFPGTLRGSVVASNDAGIWAGLPGQVQLAAREGNPVPGVSGATWVGMSSLVLNAQGKIAFFAVIRGSGIGTTNDTGIWCGSPTALAPLAREGSQAGGLSAGTKHGSLFAPVMNNTGRVAFRSSLSGTGVTTANDLAIFAGMPGALAPVCREGDPAPQTETNTKYLILEDPSINDAGQLAFLTSLSGPSVNGTNDKAIYMGLPGAVKLVTRKGRAAPGTSSGVTFVDLTSPVESGSGFMAFRGVVGGPGVTTANDEGFWCGTTAGLRLMAREGSQAPGTPTGVKFYSFITLPVVNAGGQAAFLARLAGVGVTTANDLGIWVSDSDGNLSLVAREGNTVRLGSLDVRTIATLNLIYAPAGGEDGRILSLNDAGQLSFHATFVGGSQAIVQASIAGQILDGCPNDPEKTDPGVCGCGIADVDNDGDGVLDCQDVCPGSPDEVDPDADGVPSGCDNCPNTANPDQADANNNNIGDACEVVSATRHVVQFRSMRTHSGLGALPIVLDAGASGNGSTGPTVETRLGGIQRLEIEFDGPITLALPGATTLLGRTTVAGTLNVPVAYLPSAVSVQSGNTLVLAFPPEALPDATCYTLTVGAGTLVESLTGTLSAQVRALAGDLNASGDVNLGDTLAAKAWANVPVAQCPACDVNLTGGAVNMGDLLAIKELATQAGTVMCP